MDAVVGQSHSPVELTSPAGWMIYVSHKPSVHRLVVFVHGFNGGAVTSWHDFPSPPPEREWWREADLLFVGYNSLKDNITGVANRLRHELQSFYPVPCPEAMVVDGVQARDDVLSPYEELIIVGHSLGGLIVRRLMCDAAMRWDMDAGPDQAPPIMSAQLRLFSPASAGFRAAGHLGALRATSLWRAVEIFLRRSSAYSDLQPDSPILEETRKRTETLATQEAFRALRAKIVWANPDDVVLTERYATDYVDDSWDETTHKTVCKPRGANHERPWGFVETGTSR